MKKTNKYYSVISSCLAVSHDKRYIFVELNKSLFCGNYSPYQQAFMLKLISKHSKSRILSDEKKNIWYKIINRDKTYIPYEEEIEQLEKDGFITKTINSFKATTYTLTDKSLGYYCFPYSDSIFNILQRGL